MKKLILILLILLVNTGFAGENKNLRLSRAEITPLVLRYIGEYYIDNIRINPPEMLKGALNQLQKNAAEILVQFETANRFTVTIGSATKKFSPKSLYTLNDLWLTLREVYTFIEMHYHGSIDPDDLEYLSVDGMLSVLDPHSNILTPKVFNEFKIGTRGKFGGIGIVIGTKDGELTVISPIEGTPAWRAGLKSGDKITQIGEESTINMSLTEAVEILRGDVGTAVNIVVERKGRPAPFTVSLKRAVIKIESVQSTPIKTGDRTVGYIKIKNFQEDTEKEFSKQLAKLKETPDFAGLVLDLRNDPGGLLDQAVAVVDKFLQEGVIVSTVGANNQYVEEEKASESGTEPNYPVVVLVNEGSASASEIVTGTLQAYGRAIVIGTQTFGKGSVQTIYDLKNGAGLKLTIAEYLTAGRNTIQSVGVTPDIELTPAIVDKTDMNLVADVHENEGSLDAHLGSISAAKKGKALFKLGYFQLPEPKDQAERDRREYSSKLDVSKDFAAQFAAKIVAAGARDRTSNILAQAKMIIKAAGKEENQKIAKELEKLSVDWSDCSTKEKPQLHVQFEIEKKGEPVKRATAGDEVNLVLTAKNIGSGEFCRLIGVISSKEDSINNKEFVFGKLPAGQTKKWSVPFKLPKSLITQNLPFTVKFQENGVEKMQEFKAILPINGLAEPHYSIKYKIGAPENVKVESKPIPMGKVVPFIVEIKNTGKGTSPDAVAIIKGVDAKGLFIDTGRIKIGKIEPGQTKTARFRFHLESSFADTAFKVELTIVDQDLLTGISQKIDVTVDSGVMSPKANIWYEGPRISLKTAELPVLAKGPKHLVEGEISDNNQVKDYFVFVGEEKTTYQPNPSLTSKFGFSAELPLKEGNNIVTIFARDQNDLTSRYSFSIDRK